MGWVVATLESVAQVESARQDLKRLGFTYYIPRFKEPAVLRGRKIWKITLLFGRYFFVKICDSWRSLLSIRGIKDLFLKEDLTPLVVRHHVIDEIRSREVNGFVDLKKSPHRFTPNQSVEFQSGPFKGSVGQYRGLGKQNREVVLLSLLGALTRVECDPGVLSAV